MYPPFSGCMDDAVGRAERDRRDGDAAPASPAAPACCGVTRPAVWPPSESTTTTAGGRVPFCAPLTDWPTCTACTTASASAVPCGPALRAYAAGDIGQVVRRRRDHGRMIGERDHRHAVAVGQRVDDRSATAFAAASRVGGESLAAIEPETSSTSTTVASCFLTVSSPSAARSRRAAARRRPAAAQRGGAGASRGGSAPCSAAAPAPPRPRRARRGGDRATT